MSISDNLLKLRSEIPGNVSIVAVSKRKTVEDILEAYNNGQLIFGENRVQELTQKQSVLPNDIQWHMVGHLQTNKVKYIAGFVDTIHSIDSLKLLQTINREAEKANRIISCLLQVHIASEENKFGFSRIEIEEIIRTEDFKTLNSIQITGVMGMATFTMDQEKIRSEFRDLHEIYTELKAGFFASDPRFRNVSMGMSGDYNIALEEGSTMLRLGTVIFGPRNY